MTRDTPKEIQVLSSAPKKAKKLTPTSSGPDALVRIEDLVQ
jgi:hypothetical protein